MLTQAQLDEIKARIQSEANLQSDATTLLAEVEQLQGFVRHFSADMNSRLLDIEKDMTSLEEENARLRKANESTYFERDACVALIAKLALKQGMTVGTVENRVVLDLPSGQVSWEFLESEAHLFQDLPAYGNPLQIETIRDIYLKVMNPNLDN